MQSTKGPLRYPSGNIIGIFGISRNITKQKEAEVCLQESEERFRKLFEDTRQPIVPIQNGRFIAANQASLATLRMNRPDQFIGRTPEEFSPERQPDGRLTSEKMRDAIATAFERGSKEFKWEHIRAVGEHFIARVLLTLTRQGNKDILHVVWNDITEQKNAERELAAHQKDLERRVAERTVELSSMAESLRRSNEEQQAIFDAATVSIMLTRDRIIERCNRTMEQIFGYEAGELHSKSTFVLYGDRAIFDDIGQNIVADLASQSIYREERKVFHKDGASFWARLSAQAIDRNDFDKGLAGTFEDITVERAALEEMENAKVAAEEATAAKSNFLANMSHEIRTPMNADIGMTHLALKADPGPRVRDYLQKIQISSRYLLGIINDILDHSKIEAGKMSIENVNFELDRVLESAVGLIIERATLKGLELIVDVASDVPRQLVGDPLRLGQVLVNYLNNAVKFTENGEIVIRVATIQQSEHDVVLRFSVRDNGIAVAEEQRRRLLKSFRQVDTSTTRKYGGTGLGLVIAKRLAEAMGGDLGVESLPVNGSTLWFTARLGKAPQQAKRFKIASDLGSRRALVVDDLEQARQIEEEMLRSIGLVTTSVASGREALAEISRAAADGALYELILLDWKMPEMDGVTVAEKI